MVAETPPMSRSAKLATVDAYLAQADKLASEAEMLRGGKPSSTFREQLSDAVRGQLVTFAPSWAPLIDKSGSRFGLVETIQVLRALRERIRTSRPTALTDESRQQLQLRTSLFVWGDLLADTATGNRVNPFHPNDVRAFVATLPDALASARAALDSRPAIAATFALCEERVELESFARGDAETWRAAWGLITIAYLLADKLGDPLHLFRYRLVPFPAMRRTRRDLIVDTVECPECGSQREIDEGMPNRAFEAGQWRCDECNVAGYFPKSIPHGTVWDDDDEPTAAEVDEGDDGAADDRVEVAEVHTIDLSWVSDATLRRIAEADFVDIGRCITAGAYKPALFSAGSACEGMLLYVLLQNEPLVRTYLNRPQDWPDRVSLDVMIDIGMKENVLTDTHATAAAAVRMHRDLVHPNRARAARITIDHLTARALAHAALLIARDLAEAARDGRIAAFAAKQVGT